MNDIQGVPEKEEEKNEPQKVLSSEVHQDRKIYISRLIFGNDDGDSSYV